MSVLAIHLSRSVCNEIARALGEVVYCTDRLTDAFEQLQNQDFNLVLCCISSVPVSPESFEILIGLTLISTRIIVVGDTNQITSFKRYAELGVELLANPSTQEILDCIKADLEVSEHP